MSTALIHTSHSPIDDTSLELIVTKSSRFLAHIKGLTTAAQCAHIARFILASDLDPERQGCRMRQLVRRARLLQTTHPTPRLDVFLSELVGVTRELHRARLGELPECKPVYDVLPRYHILPLWAYGAPLKV